MDPQNYPCWHQRTVYCCSTRTWSESRTTGFRNWHRPSTGSLWTSPNCRLGTHIFVIAHHEAAWNSILKLFAVLWFSKFLAAIQWVQSSTMIAIPHWSPLHLDGHNGGCIAALWWRSSPKSFFTSQWSVCLLPLAVAQVLWVSVLSMFHSLVSVQGCLRLHPPYGHCICAPLIAHLPRTTFCDRSLGFAGQSLICHLQLILEINLTPLPFMIQVLTLTSIIFS